MGNAILVLGSGNFFTEPVPVIKLRQPNRVLHVG
jgi:hypothetical protein